MNFGALWARFYAVILAVLAALGAAIALYARGHAAGKAVEQKKATERDLTEAKQHAETIRETVDVQAEISRVPDSDLDERLRKWTRD